jgi:Uma2 family endonuclease
MLAMATVDDRRTTGNSATGQKAPQSGPRRWRWTTEQFRELANAGFFRDRHVELINGKLIELVVNPPRDTGVYLALTVLQRVFRHGFVVRPQLSLDLGRRYQPLPDVAVAVGEGRDYATRHPTTAVLLVEVADSSLRYDRVVKAHRYARAGIPDYWIVNIVDRQLEVHRIPGPDPARPGRYRYADVTIVAADGQVIPIAQPGQPIVVADLLP